ncbi:nitroreductase [Amorphus sp. 3PC139-8]|uniref:nitroreductase n=1 Tax=Amorphus sp. 3PC139-8 TaxID=2735676 RepID=UPI00345CED19
MTDPATSRTATRPTSEAADTLERLLRGRYSCRGFRPDPVPRETVVRILEIAGRTPSWCNVQPWHLTIVEGARLKALSERLYDHVQSHSDTPDFAFPTGYSEERHARRRECGFQLYECVGVARGDREAARRQALENFRFFGAPHVAFVTSHKELGPYGAIDCGGFVTAFLLAARSLDVDTIPQAAVAGFPDFLRQELGIQDDRALICAISFGYGDETHPANAFRTRRASVDEIATWLD